MQEIVLAAALIVLNKSAHEAVIVEPSSREVVARISTGLGPHEVAVSPDGSRAYVADYGAYNVFREGSRSGPGNTLTVLDLEEKKVLTTWDLGEYTQPHGIVVSRDGRSVWVTTEGAESVLELDAATGTIRKVWKTGQRVSHMVVATPDEKKLFVTNIGSGTVTVIDRKTDKVRTVETGEGAEGIDVSPSGKEVWVSNRGDSTISVLSTETDEVLAAFPSGGTMPIRVKFTPDGTQVYVSNARSASVSVFDAATRERLGTVEVGAVPVGIQMSPDGKNAFVANTNDDKVSVIDVESRRVTGTFSPGKEPDGMAWIP
jgi:YVTN family beta-propeller protein